MNFSHEMNQVKVGRKPRLNKFIDIQYNNKHYCIGVLETNNGPVKFVFDAEDKSEVINYHWFLISKMYIGAHIDSEDGTRKIILLHNLVMKQPHFPGKGAAQTVDHINRIPLDNRKENLCVKTQTEQNINQKKKPRKIVQLPDGCGIPADELPRHIWYIKANGGHGDRFAVECKSIGFVWKTTSSKNVSLREKLQQAKDKLQEIYEQQPELNPEVQQETIQPLVNSFEEIIASVPA
jgi:hypothetical protein